MTPTAITSIPTRSFHSRRADSYSFTARIASEDAESNPDQREAQEEAAKSNAKAARYHLLAAVREFDEGSPASTVFRHTQNFLHHRMLFNLFSSEVQRCPTPTTPPRRRPNLISRRSRT